MTRRSEWFASIRPILERDDAKRDAKELAQELSDILEVKVSPDASSLDELGKEFNRQLVEMGKQPVVFSDKTLHGIIGQFASAIVEGINKGLSDIQPIQADPVGKEMGDRIGKDIAGSIVDGVSDGLKDAGRNLEAEFDVLIQKQANKIKELEKLQSKIRRKEDVGNKLELDPYVKGSVQLDDNFAEYAENIIYEQDDINERLEQAIEEGKVTEKLLKEWVKTTQKYRDVYRTVSDMDQSYAKKLLGSDFGYFTDDAYEIRTQIGFDTIEEFVDTDGLQDSLGEVEKELQDLQVEIDNILRERPEFISKKEELEAVNRLQRIQQAYEKLNKTATGRKTIDKIETALSHKGAGAEVTAMPEQPTLGVYDKGYRGAQEQYESQLKKHTETYERAKKALEKAFEAYDNSAGKSWDERYRLLIKAAEEFESLENNPNLSNKDKEDALGGYRNTFEEEIKPIKDIARSMLQDIINLRDGKELVTTRTPSREDDIAPNAEDVSNAQKLTEETKDKADAETRARDEAEKKKLADEASAAANHDAADEAEREQQAKEASVKAEEERQRLLKNKDAIATMHDTRGEAGAFFNSETGEFSDVIAGGDHSVETERSAWEKAAEAFDTRIHKHNYDVAAPSFSGEDNDFAVWIKGFDIFKKQMILANKEILSFDFSSLESVDTLREIARKYREGATEIDAEFNDYFDLASGGPSRFKRKYGIEGTSKNMNEQLQVELRKVIDKVMEGYQGIMTSISLPTDMIKDSSEPKISAEKAEELRRDSIERYANAKARQAQADAQRELNDAEEEGQKLSLEEKYDASSDEVKKKYQELVALQDKITEMEANPDSGRGDEQAAVLDRLRTVYDELAELDAELYDNFSGADNDTHSNFFEHIRQDALAAKPAVEALNDSIEETKNVAQSSDDGIGAGDTSSVEPAVADKTKALQDEIEQKNKELAVKDDEIARIQAESEAEKRVLGDEKATLQNDLDQTRQQLADTEYEKGLYDSAMNQLTKELNEKDRIIYDLREQLANVKTGVSDERPSVGMDELKRILGEVTYNVKIAHDDNDKTANKVAINTEDLGGVLKEVFANILSPHTEQNDSEPKNEPWALEKTLQTVKGVLDNIQTNTSKSESVEIAPAKVEVGNVLATENTLAAIKTAVEGINSKVVKGTKAKTSENGGKKKAGVGKKNAESYSGSQYFPEKIKTQTMYLAKFRAQLMTTGKLTDDVDAQIYELLDGLKRVQNGPDLSKWNQQFLQLKTSVGIEDIFEKAEDKVTTASYEELIELQKTRNKLELQYEKAQDGSALKQFYAEQLTQMNSVIAKQEEILENEEYEAKLAKIREEQARKLGEVEAKASDKVAKKAATDQKKLDKRRAMTGKAGSAIGRAEGVWLEAEGLEKAKLPEDFKKQINEYYDALDKLRVKHHEINTSEVVTDEQQAELIAQTKEVNRLTEDIGSLVVEYQKLSGSNVDEADARATTLTGKSGLSEYETTLKQYVRDITNGKGQIKSFNAETKTLTYTVKTGKNEFTEYTAAVRGLDHKLVSVQGTTKKTETFLEATTRKMRELTSYFSGMAVFNFAKQELRRGIQYVREIDLALTELRKVTDETEETYDRFLETAAKTADKVGSTIQKVVSSTADWARLGSILAKTNIRPVM